MHNYEEKQKHNLAGNADWARDAAGWMKNCQCETVPLDLKCLYECTSAYTGG